VDGVNYLVAGSWTIGEQPGSVFGGDVVVSATLDPLTLVSNHPKLAKVKAFQVWPG